MWQIRWMQVWMQRWVGPITWAITHRSKIIQNISSSTHNQDIDNSCPRILLRQAQEPEQIKTRNLPDFIRIKIRLNYRTRDLGPRRTRFWTILMTMTIISQSWRSDYLPWGLGRSVALVLADRAVTSRLLVELHSWPLAELLRGYQVSKDRGSWGQKARDRGRVGADALVSEKSCQTGNQELQQLNNRKILQNYLMPWIPLTTWVRNVLSVFHSLVSTIWPTNKHFFKTRRAKCVNLGRMAWWGRGTDKIWVQGSHGTVGQWPNQG